MSAKDGYVHAYISELKSKNEIFEVETKIFSRGGRVYRFARIEQLPAYSFYGSKGYVKVIYEDK